MRATHPRRAGVGLAAAAWTRPSPGWRRPRVGDDRWNPAVSDCWEEAGSGAAGGAGRLGRKR
jgi:hypothetical protein